MVIHGWGEIKMNIERFKQNLEILKQHNITHEPIYHITDGKLHEVELINEIVKDGEELLKNEKSRFDLLKETTIEKVCNQEDNFFERLAIYFELKEYAESHNNIIDWKNPAQDKYNIEYNYTDDSLGIYSICYYRHSFEIYFSSHEIAYDAIREIGEDRIKKYLYRERK